MARLLVVDDESQLLYSLGEYLSRCGHEVRSASSGAEALAALAECPPDLIVSDILMDEMDGFEFHRRVCGLTGGAVPFIFLTAKGDRSDRVAGLRGGADDYVVKPFDPDELEARVTAVLARIELTRRQERSNAQQAGSLGLGEASEHLDSPVTAMVRELDRLRSQVADTQRHAPGEQVERALHAAGELEALASDLSWTAEDGRAALPITRSPQRIAPIVRTAAAAAARRASERGVGLQISCGGLLSGNVDGEALQRSLAGLLELTVDLSPKGSHVRIQARRSEEGGLEISITGEGRRDAHGESLALDDPKRRALKAARHVVRAHGGRFDATARPTGVLALAMWLPGRVTKHVGRRA